MNIIIADDHALIRKGLKQILLEEFPSARVDECRDAEELIKKSLHDHWDVVVCDLLMPGKTGLDVVQHMKQHAPRTPVLVLSMYPEEQYAIRALKTGAAGYLSKDSAPEELVRAVHRVLMGRKYISPSLADKLVNELDQESSPKPAHELLTHREFGIFQLLAAGKSISAIADQLSISASTVSTYRAKILTKMNLGSNADLTRYALENKLI
ncbi:MAG TPA: response regulator transcription factor [Dinghuibacter sp.]|uniref:response regulator transcription factor n=1 Tax=Dinghuibacter sp. TaxID=2024697 RepID=UPI002B925B77|nr:response regulator transcription factor [Dinghuibacter sp.]HTJ10688.1 response regulator transcription factor [Dinghuibacter sp.]